MIYLKTLPQQRHLRDLAESVSFPAARHDLIRAALRKHYAFSTVLFLQLFSADDVFQNRVDFVNQCEELKLMIHEERLAPKEILRSP